MLNPPDGLLYLRKLLGFEHPVPNARQDFSQSGARGSRVQGLQGPDDEQAAALVVPDAPVVRMELK